MTGRSSLDSAVAEVLRRRHLVGSTLNVAVSGGPDSVALLVALAREREALKVTLHVSHFDHQLRAESKNDAEFVRELCAKLDLPFMFGQANVGELARRRRQGIEETARTARYCFLGEVATSVGAAAVLTGHTADDQIETQLLHVIRGSGLRGLRGMSEDSLISGVDCPPVRVVRPLLAVSRVATEARCREAGIVPRIDGSNSDLAFRRNRLRLEVVPILRELNPRVAEALTRLARSAADAEDFVEGELDRRIESLADTQRDPWIVDRPRWRELPLALKQALLRRAAGALGSGSDVGAEAIDAAIVAADSWTAGKVLEWPAGRQVRVEHDRFEIGTATRPSLAVTVRQIPSDRDSVVELDPLPDALCRMSGSSVPCDGRPVLCARLQSSRCPARHRDPWHADLDRDKLEPGNQLTIRCRNSGDWLAPFGGVGQRKLQDVLTDRHVPARERDRVPIVTSASDVMWIVGVCHDRRFLAGPESTNVLCLDVTSGDGG